MNNTNTTSGLNNTNTSSGGNKTNTTKNSTIVIYLNTTNSTNTTKIDWSGQIVKKGPWQNQTLFYIGNYRVTS